MTDMPLDEALQFESVQVLPSTSGQPVFAAPERPVGSGINWLVSNTHYLARVTSINTIDILLGNDALHTITTSSSSSSSIVQIAFSSSLLAVALSDGSLECYNILLESTELRWRLENSHSFVTNDSIETPLSSNREAGASDAGPIAALAFDTTSSNLLVLVDASEQTATIWNAAHSNPVPIATIDDATCAIWMAGSSAGATMMAMGKATGEIVIYSVNGTAITLTTSIESPAEDGSCCTHLNSFLTSNATTTTLLAGFCNVIPADHEDEDDDDDAAEHMASMYLASFEGSALSSEWTDVGDVVPFFSVPKHGRHLFYSQALSPAIVVVAANVGSDIGVIHIGNDEPLLLDLPEGANATTPTTEDDDYTFCIGLASAAGALYVAATDGTVTHFRLTHAGDANYIDTSSTANGSLKLIPISEATTAASPVKTTESLAKTTFGAPTTTGTQPAHGASTTKSAFGAQPVFGVSPAKSSFGTQSTFGASPAKSPFGTQPAFGASPVKSTFGATSALAPASFGVSAAKPSFGTSFGAFGGATPGKSNSFNFGTSADTKTGFSFGSTSVMGVKSPSPEKKTSTPAPAVSTFGSGTNMPSFGASFQRDGFGSLAASEGGNKSFGFGASSPTKNTPDGASPFGAFAAKSASTPGSSGMAKPLFGSSPATTPAASPVKKEVAPPVGAQTVTSEEENNLPGAKAAARAFDSLDIRKSGRLSKDIFEELLEELGEGFHGDEFDAQLEKVVDLSTSGAASDIERAAFIKWYCGLQAGDDDENSELDEDELAERELERKRVRECFEKVSKDGGESISIEDFPGFFDQMGSTYDGDGEHGKAANKMKDASGNISWSIFIDWYIHWLFDEDEDYEDDDVEEAYRESSGPSSTTEGWGGMFSKPADSWKCEVCMIQNESAKKKCVSCETVRPGCEDEVAKEDAAASGAGGSGSGGGAFSFGAPVKSSSFSFGTAPATGNSFGFGAPAAGAPAAASGSFTFGAPAAATTDGSKATFGFGVASASPSQATFGFGVPGKKEEAKKEESKKIEAKRPSPKKMTASGYPPMSAVAPKNPFDGKNANAPAKTVSTPSSSGDEPDYAALLTTFYQKNDPDRIKDVQKLVNRYKGKEHELIAKLAGKYKVANPFDLNYIPYLVKFYEQYEPGKEKSAAKIVKKYQGKEDQMIANLAKKFKIEYPFDAIGAKTNSTTTPETASASKKVSSTASSGYPPMSGTAPTNPFGKKALTAAPKASSGYPPMSTAAPTNPFGKSATTAAAPVSAKVPTNSFFKPAISATTAPLSTKALTNPFGKPAATASTASPSPFGKPAGGATAPEVSKGMFGGGGAVPAFGNGSSLAGFGGKSSVSPSAPSPFAAFAKPTGATGGFASTMAKPLFGSLPAPAPASAKNAEVSPQKSKLSPQTNEEEDTTPGAKSAARAFDSLDDTKSGQLSTSYFEELLEELGEGFHGDEFDAQLAIVDPSGTKQIQRAAFIKWYCGLQAGDDDENSELDEDELAEREEERVRVREFFEKVSKDGGESISIEDFPGFFDQMGSTYDGDGEHGKAANKMKDASGNISWSIFIDWYIHWLYDEDEDYEDDEEVVKQAPSEALKNSTSEGWGGMFSKPADSWKCEVCMIQNESAKKKCVSCETVRPGCEDEVAKEDAAASGAGGSGSGGGAFSFGAPAAAASGGSFGFGAPAATSTGKGGSFGFGAPAATSTGAGGTFGFGAPGATSTGKGGTFGFGAPASGSTVASKTTVGVGASSKETGKKAVTFGKKEESKAPEPKKQPDAASAYPPMSAAAPKNPFGKTSATPAPKKAEAAASGYPPMSSKAPSNPFGSTPVAPTKAVSTVSVSSSSSVNYTALLTDFYAKHDPDRVKLIPRILTKYAGKEAEMGPKLASKYNVANPFDSGGKSATPAPATSGYPPMSTKAPSNPFGKSSTPAPTPKTVTPSASAHPPNLTKSASPFGAPAALGYPPMSTNAPSNPFGKSSTPAPTSKTIAPAASGYPPMSANAPSNPFGKTSVPAPIPKAMLPAASGYSSMPPNAPLNSFGKSSAPASVLPPMPSKTPSAVFATSSRPMMNVGSMSTPSRQARKEVPSRPVSQFETQFVDEMAKFQEIIQSLSQTTALPLDAFEKEVRQLVTNREKMWNYSEDFKAEVATHKDRSLFLCSRRPDIERQIAEAQRLIKMNAEANSGQGGLLSSQQLDANSERTRRRMAAEAIMIPRKIDILEARLNLMECASNDEARRMDLESSGREVLFEMVKNSSDLSNLVNRASARSANSVMEISAKVPRSWSSQKSPPPSSRKGRSRIGAHPGVDKGVKSLSETKAVVLSQSSGAHRWKRIEQQFQRKRKDATKQININLPPRVLAFQHDKPAEKPIGSKTDQSSFLLSPQQVAKSDRRRTDVASITADLFAPPSSLTVRPEWEAGFTTDQAKAGRLSFNLPRHLKEVNTVDAVRDSLAQYGTTPEKLGKVMEAKRRGEAAARNPIDTASQVQPSTPKRSSASSSAPLPPMPTKAPTPFAQASSTAAGAIPKPSVQPKSSGYPPMSKISSKPFGTAANSAGATAKVQKDITGKIESSSFGGMKSLGDSLFGDKPSVPLAPSTGSFGGAPAKLASSGPDFPTELTKFYETHNPSKVKDVAKHLERYKGREHEMFGKLASKYKVANPLDAIGAGMPSKQAAATAFGPTSASPKPSTPFGAAASTPAPSTPFGASSSTPAPSNLFNTAAPGPASVTPFGAASTSAPASITPFGAAASTPAPNTSFGSKTGVNTAATASAVPFGAKAAPSPFGATMQPASAFGGAAPAPFGSSPSPFGASQAIPAPAPVFGATMSTDSPFGKPNPTAAPSTFGATAPASFGAAAPTQPSFAGKSPRDMLYAFYQQYNASKLHTVDQVLQKYRGQEEKLFRNLVKKYNLDPSVFGLSNPAPSSGGGFGQTSPMGGAAGFGGGTPAAAPAFGSPSAMGGTSTPFGGGGGFAGGAPAPAAAFGNTSAFGGTPTSGGFGSLAQQGGSGGFGAAAAAGGGGFGTAAAAGGSGFGAAAAAGGSSFGAPAAGSGFGTPAAGGFGGASPFGAPSGGGFGGSSPFGGPRR